MIRIKEREGHYTIKIVDKLPKKGNANWLFALRGEEGNTTISELFEWSIDKKSFESIKIGSSTETIIISGGENVTVTGDGTSSSPYTLSVEGSGELLKGDEGNGEGLFLNINRDNHGPIGLEAIDLSFRDDGTPTVSGERAFSVGQDNVVQSYLGFSIGGDNTVLSNGLSSGAFGIENSVDGVVNFAFGAQNTINLGPGGVGYNFVSGRNNVMDGTYGGMVGSGLINKSSGSFIVGRANEDYTNSASNPNFNAPLFVVGNGTIDNSSATNLPTSRSNAFEVFKDGSVIAKDLTASLIEANAQSLITKQYFDDNSGDSKIIEIGNNNFKISDFYVGFESAFETPLFNTIDFSTANGNSGEYGSSGNNNVTFGEFQKNAARYSIMSGRFNVIESDATNGAIIGGQQNTLGGNSNSLRSADFGVILGGQLNVLEGPYNGIIGGRQALISGVTRSVIAGGEANSIEGSGSRSSNFIAAGSRNVSSGDFNFLAGYGNYARGRSEFSIGDNGTDYTPTSESGAFLDGLTNRLFNVGNGTTTEERDAFTIYRNGAVQLHPIPQASITNAEVGMMVIDSTDSNKLKFYDGTAWRTVSFT